MKSYLYSSDSYIENDSHSFIIPDKWPGIISDGQRMINEGSSISTFSNFRKDYIQINWNNVLLVSNNNYVGNGVRFCLEDRSNIRLKHLSTYDNICNEIDEFRPASIILVESEPCNAKDIINCLLHLTSISLVSKVIIISDQSFSFFERLKDTWKIFSNINIDNDFEYIKNNLLKSTSDSSKSIYPLIKVLTNKQREVLKFLAKGYDYKQIASFMNLNIKTISIHKMHALQRLGVINKLQEYWVLYAIQKNGDCI